MNDLPARLNFLYLFLVLGCIGTSFSNLGSWSTFTSFCAPLLWAIVLRRGSLSQALAVSLTFGFGGWLVSAWWLANGISGMNSSYWWAGYLSVLILGLIGSFPYLLFGVLSHYLSLFRGHHSRPILAAALISLCVELSPNPFPGSLVNGVASTLWLLQPLDLGGAILIHFIIFSTSFLLANSFNQQEGLAWRLRTLMMALAILGATFGYSVNKKHEWSQQISQLSPFYVGLVQPNIPIKDGNNFGKPGSLSSLGEQTKTLLSANPPPDLIVWPEIPIYFSPFNGPNDQAYLDQLLAGTQTPLLVSADLFANEQRYGRIPFYNSVQLLRGSSQIYGEYRKMILVPMGEYLPFEEFFSGEYWKDFLRDVRRYAPGRELSVITISTELSVGTPICLEILHSHHVGEMIKLGAQILVNPSNDGYFGLSPGAQLNFNYSRLRAIEYRIPVVRVTNTGISAVIDQRGETIPKSLFPEFEPTSAIITLFPSRKSSPAILPREWGIMLLGLFSIVGILRMIGRPFTTNQ